MFSKQINVAKVKAKKTERLLHLDARLEDWRTALKKILLTTTVEDNQGCLVWMMSRMITLTGRRQSAFLENFVICRCCQLLKCKVLYACKGCVLDLISKDFHSRYNLILITEQVLVTWYNSVSCIQSIYILLKFLVPFGYDVLANV